MPNYNFRTKAEKIHARLSQDLPINSAVSVAIVPDPYGQNGEKIQVLRSTRTDALAGMFARNWIDEAQLNAGRKWERLFESAEIGSIRGFDPTKEAVDGGKAFEPVTDRQIMALRKLDEAHRWLGRDGYGVVFSVLGQRQLLKTAAESHGYVTAREVDYFSRRFRECLETLAILWGYAQRPLTHDK